MIELTVCSGCRGEAMSGARRDAASTTATVIGSSPDGGVFFRAYAAARLAETRHTAAEQRR